MARSSVDGFFEALADPTRRQVVQLLAAGPQPAGQLAKSLGTSPSAMSRHLRVLLDAGVVQDERVPDDARLRVFRLRHESLEIVRLWLEQVVLPHASVAEY